MRHADQKKSVVLKVIRRLGRSLIAVVTMVIPLLLSILKTEAEEHSNYGEMKLNIVSDPDRKLSQHCTHRRDTIEQGSVLSERYTTGLLEDIELRLCLGIERAGKGAQVLLKELEKVVGIVKKHRFGISDITPWGLSTRLMETLNFAKDSAVKLMQLQTYSRMVSYFFTFPAEVGLRTAFA